MTTLLIVDDNSEMRQLVRRIMSKVCDEIFECEDGDEVLAAFATHHPDWILMDIEMKRTDGLTATAQLMRSYPEAKVIVVSKYTDQETRQAASNAGACSFLGKDDLLSFRMIVKGRSAAETK